MKEYKTNEVGKSVPYKLRLIEKVMTSPFPELTLAIEKIHYENRKRREELSMEYYRKHPFKGRGNIK